MLTIITNATCNCFDARTAVDHIYIGPEGGCLSNNKGILFFIPENRRKSAHINRDYLFELGNELSAVASEALSQPITPISNQLCYKNFCLSNYNKFIPSAVDFIQKIQIVKAPFLRALESSNQQVAANIPSEYLAIAGSEMTAECKKHVFTAYHIGKQLDKLACLIKLSAIMSKDHNMLDFGKTSLEAAETVKHKEINLG